MNVDTDSDYVTVDTDTETDTDLSQTSDETQAPAPGQYQDQAQDQDHDQDQDQDQDLAQDQDQDQEETFIDTLPIEDAIELEITTYEMLDDMATGEIAQMCDPDFHEKLIDEIADHLHAYLMDLHMCVEGDYPVIQDFVKKRNDVYFDTITDIPRRSLFYSVPTPDITICAKIEHLSQMPQPKQRTQEWYTFRNQLISASSIGKIFGSASQFNSLVYEKCKPQDYSNTSQYVNTESPLHWGNKYEPLSVKIYEDRYKTTVGDFGCIQHPKYPFIGASPDGINIDPLSPRYGRMLEVKNIVNREITGIPKHEYWIQMQIQMETCDLEECDFLETRFKEYSEKAFYEDDTKDKGVILYFIKHSRVEADSESKKLGWGVSNIPHYVYMPVTLPKTKSAINAWIKTTKETNHEFVLFNTLYWYLDEFSCVLVQRNRAWFHSVLPKIESTWQTIEKERETGYEHRSSKKRQTPPIIVSNQAVNSDKQIKNMQVSKRICLVKIE